MFTTLGLVVLAVLVILVIVLVCHQMITSPFMWIMHACNGTLGMLFEVLGVILQAIAEAVGSAFRGD